MFIILDGSNMDERLMPCRPNHVVLGQLRLLCHMGFVRGAVADYAAVYTGQLPLSAFNDRWVEVEGDELLVSSLAVKNVIKESLDYTLAGMSAYYRSASYQLIGKWVHGSTVYSRI